MLCYVNDEARMLCYAMLMMKRECYAMLCYVNDEARMLCYAMLC